MTSVYIVCECITVLMKKKKRARTHKTKRLQSKLIREKECLLCGLKLQAINTHTHTHGVLINKTHAHRVLIIRLTIYLIEYMYNIKS